MPGTSSAPSLTTTQREVMRWLSSGWTGYESGGRIEINGTRRAPMSTMAALSRKGHVQKGEGTVWSATEAGRALKFS